MKQYDAGPGDWSDRPWEDPEKKPQPHARRRKVSLPPWALLAIFAAVIILLCVGLVLIIRAIRGGGEDATATPLPVATATARQTAVIPLPTTPTAALTPPTATVVLPIGGTAEATPMTEIGPGATVVVKGTGGAGLNLRQQPSTTARVTGSFKEGTELTVLDGPQEADGYVWWQLRAKDGTEGWAAANWLLLKTDE